MKERREGRGWEGTQKGRNIRHILQLHMYSLNGALDMNTHVYYGISGVYYCFPLLHSTTNVYSSICIMPSTAMPL